MTSGIGLCSDMTLEGPRRCDTFAHDMTRAGSSHDIYDLREELLQMRWNMEYVKCSIERVASMMMEQR